MTRRKRYSAEFKRETLRRATVTGHLNPDLDSCIGIYANGLGQYNADVRTHHVMISGRFFILPFSSHHCAPRLNFPFR